MPVAAEDHHESLLANLLPGAFGDLDGNTLALLRERLHWLHIAAGQTLMAQGEAGDALYLLVSGRLRAYVQADDDTPARMVREMGRGEVVGEMSLFTGEPRSATVIAIRDSLLVRLDKAHFERLLASSAQAALALTRQVIHRLRTESAPQRHTAPVVIGLFAITDGIDAAGLAARLAAQLGRAGGHTRQVALVDAAQAHAVGGSDDEADASRRITTWLDEIEARHDVVLLRADAEPSAWSRLCARHCDELLLFARADAPPLLHALESECLMRRQARAEAAEILVLLHDEGARSPSGTTAWLARRPMTEHLHLRPAHERDIARLARYLSRTSIGLVLAGGGARGFAHLGVLRALQEHGIEIDRVGGTSMGAVMAALVASGRPLDELMQVARAAFRVNPTGDFNWLPLASLIKGERLRAAIDGALHTLLGARADVEDLRLPFFCIATNYSQAREEPLQRGALAHALLASTAIPGALPPVVHDGDLLCDGGSFNNFPVDVMRSLRGIGAVIGVDLSFRHPRRLEFDEVPGPWTLLRDRLRPRKQRRYRLPALPAYLLNTTILYSMSRQRQARALTDLHFNPPLDRVGLLQWKRFDAIVQQGYEHALEVLARPEVAARFSQSNTDLGEHRA